ncbi:hypothetical protein GA607_03815 [Bifidobacterium adolescentis]|nr:hypothetical protein GA606_05245 [Bifidobacterium adolescentis]KAB5920354.1 hypothetical protein GA608_04240 [Bifidobacterium adolescentis]KAB5922891.1 hypothetical protein GA607_03815 [Bifidobacterium adolescentis]KAB5925949.1 hypothetical protein GA605_04250 [Bifidobacterium adolescentis]KAB5927569.1 hypothetical protein GA611_04245 [Bifidobacterium adolescentis]
MSNPTEQDSSETNEALDMYDRASSDTSQVEAASNPASNGGEEVDDSADEATDTASSFNARRRENAALRELDAKNTRREQENQLRKKVATWSLWFVLAQLVITNTTIVVYIAAMLVLKQYVPTEVLITWLSSTIVEIIGILWVIARSLFPFHDRHRDAKGEKHRS